MPAAALPHRRAAAIMVDTPRGRRHRRNAFPFTDRRPPDMRGVDQDKVYFECETCGHTFQDDPNQDFQECPQCGSRDTFRT